MNDYGPSLYAVRLPRNNGLGRGLALARQFGDYDRMTRNWYIAVAVPGAASAGALAELAGLGAVITREGQEGPS